MPCQLCRISRGNSLTVRILGNVELDEIGETSSTVLYLSQDRALPR